MNKYLKYICAAALFILAVGILYIVWAVTETEDAMRNALGDASLSVRGLILSWGGWLVVYLLIALGIKILVNAKSDRKRHIKGK